MNEQIFEQYERVVENNDDSYDGFIVKQIIGEAILCCAFDRVIRGEELCGA